MQTKERFTVDVTFGFVDIRTWIEFDGEQYIGMGMKRTYDKDGKLVDCVVSPTGLIARYE